MMMPHDQNRHVAVKTLYIKKLFVHAILCYLFNNAVHSSELSKLNIF